MTTPTGPAYEPDLVLRKIGSMRPRMPELLGEDWPVFKRRLDRLLARLAKAPPSQRGSILRQLRHLLMASPAAGLFRATFGPLHKAKAKPDLYGFRKPTGDLIVVAGPIGRRPKGSKRPGAVRPAHKKRWAGQVKKTRSTGKKKMGRPSSKTRAKRPPARAAPKAIRPVTPTPKPKPRVVNLAFTSRGRAVTAKRPLVVKRHYQLRIDIGPMTRSSIVKNVAAHPVRADLLPKAPEGHWLKVVAVSSRLKVAETGRWIFLPVTGPSWVCPCTPGSTHTCTQASRKRHLLLDAWTPQAPGSAELRVTLYYETAVVQSLLVTAAIVANPRMKGTHQAVIDYNLTNRLTDLAALAPRAMSVMTNDSDDGTHRIVFNGAPDKPITLVLTDDQMTAALTTMRTVMRDIHIEKIGNATPDNRFDAHNRKARNDFIADLREAAARGWLLWNAVWQERIDEWTDNETAFIGPSNVIQIARKQNSTAVFPWAMVYSIPIDTGAPANNKLCKLVGDENEWKKFQAAADSPLRCPFEATHGEDIICPYGFWGFRYQIEQPPSLKPGRTRIASIPSTPPPIDVVAALSAELDATLMKAHFKVLSAQHKNFEIKECATRDSIRKGLGTSALELVYFYCHGITNLLPGNAGNTPGLGVGKDEVINPPDLVKWVLSKAWPKDHWKAVAPLVFINGCHTADTTPQTLVSFVDTFSASLRAAGVIGTEITLHQLVANEVAEVFLNAFQRGYGVGESLRQARAALLRKGNLLGLVYTAYCSADLKLSASVV